MKSILSAAIAPLMLLYPLNAEARMLTSSPEHFHFVLEAQSTDSPEIVWARLIEPSNWWHSDHTYSGDSDNLTLDPQAGGLWREDWEGGSVAHGTILYAKPATMLRLEAPFGPLQERSIDAIWTISISPTPSGSNVKFEFVANGSSFSNLDKLALVVEMVKAQALNSLVATDGT